MTLSVLTFVSRRISFILINCNCFYLLCICMLVNLCVWVYMMMFYTPMTVFVRMDIPMMRNEIESHFSKYEQRYAYIEGAVILIKEEIVSQEKSGKVPIGRNGVFCFSHRYARRRTSSDIL